MRRLSVELGLVALRGVEGYFRGDAQCPCIDPWGDDGVPTDASFIDPESGQGCLKYTFQDRPTPLCYPMDYGDGFCRQWDEVLPPNCARLDRTPLTNAPDWCQQSWCYVNRSDCNLRPVATTLFKDHELFYSYETCDNVDTFSPELLLSSLEGRTLRLGYVAFYWPWFFIDETGDVAGFTVDWWRVLGGMGGFDIEYSPCSNASQLVENHSYDVCGRDVALTRMDSCASGQAETGRRLLKTSFSPSYFTALYYMVVFVAMDDDIFKMVLKVFLPFTPMLWATIFGICFFVGSLLWAFGETGPVVLTPAQMVVGAAKGLRVCLLEFFGKGDKKGKPATKGGKVVMFGFGFLCLVGGASYTANLGSFFLMNNLSPAVSGIDEAIQRKMNICTRQTLVPAVSAKYPGVEPLLVVVDSEAERIRYMDNGRCGAGLFDEEMVLLMASGFSIFEPVGPQCNKTKVGDPVVTVQYSVPLGADIHQAVSYLWVREKNRGGVSKVIADYPLPPSVCPALGGLRDSVPSLDTKDLSGVIIITAISCALGLAVHYGEKLGHAGAQSAMKKVDSIRLSRSGLGEATPVEGGVEQQGGNEKVGFEELQAQRQTVTLKREELKVAEDEFLSVMSRGGLKHEEEERRQHRPVLEQAMAAAPEPKQEPVEEAAAKPVNEVTAVERDERPGMCCSAVCMPTRGPPAGSP